MTEVSFTYVIVGGGIAGVSCAEILQCIDSEESILIVTASPGSVSYTHLTLPTIYSV